jgi:fumarate reductase subunit D
MSPYQKLLRPTVKHHNGVDMEESIIKKYSPVWIGVFLGIISVLIGQIPKAVAVWTGMTVLGNHVGYILGALLSAYFYAHKWWKSFLAGASAVIIATLVYYLLIFLIQSSDRNTTTASGFEEGLIIWPVIGIIVGLLSATGIWLFKSVKKNWQRRSVFGIGYIGMLFIIYISIVRFYINLHRSAPEVLARQPAGFPGAVFETAFAVVITTAVWGLAYRLFFKKE